MKFLPAAVLALTALVLNVNVVLAKKPSRPRPVSTSRRATPTRAASAPPPRKAPVSRRRPVYDENEEDEFDNGYDEIDEEIDVELFDDDEDDVEIDITETRSTKSRRSSGNRSSSRAAPPSRSSGARISSRSSTSRKRPPPRRYQEDYYDDEPPPRRPYSSGRRGPPPPTSSGRRSGGRVVPYAKPGAGQTAAATFTRGLAAIKNVMPDPSSVKDAALSGLSAARETTSNLSSNLYREIKGLTSSELEQVMLKATRPDDTAVKGKHVERLVGVTYQISPEYDIYDAVLRKLWSKMAEKDWRTTMKALYILHRFSADGAPEHAPALKARLRELRRTLDPKRKVKYFDTKQLLAGDGNPDNIKFRAFMSRYAHYVLLRAQCFCGLFDEIAHEPKPEKRKKKSTPKPITLTSLRLDHLNAARVLLKAGVVCHLKEGEECENTAIAAERVASDMIGLTTAVAFALNRALKDDDLKGADPAILKQWCVFYSEELLPETKAMVKKTSPKLDAYGLFLPSRMGATLSQDLLEKGLNLEEEEVKSEPSSAQAEAESGETSEAQDSVPASKARSNADAEPKLKTEPLKDEDGSEIEDEEAIEEEAEFDDEYEYEEEEYYDEEE